jgi:hypothetical protein
MSFDPFRIMRESVRTNLSTALARNWRRQNGVDRDAQVPREVSVKFDLETFQNVADDVARNACQPFADLVEMARAYCLNTHDQHDGQCRVDHCPFYVDPS